MQGIQIDWLLVLYCVYHVSLRSCKTTHRQVWGLAFKSALMHTR